MRTEGDLREQRAKNPTPPSLQDLKAPKCPATTISLDQLSAEGVRELMRKSVPCCIEVPQCETNIKKIEQLLAEHIVTLVQFPKVQAVMAKAVSSQLPFKEFFADQRYNRPGDPNSYRIVSNIKNDPMIISNLFGCEIGEKLNYNSALNSANIWVSYLNSFSRAHFDELENFNLQLVGSKRFILYPPGTRNYYVQSPFGGNGHYSTVPDLETADLERFPHVRDALNERVVIDLTPGKMIYIPIGWWHQVYSREEVNINLNLWLASPRILRHPYVLFDTIYKTAFRRLNGIYDYAAAPISREKKPKSTELQ